MDPIGEWLRFAPAPPPLIKGKKWHVFLSCRSVHRAWVIELYHILKKLGFEVFLDRYVLHLHDNLLLSLQQGLDESVAGVLIWSSRTEDSKWCQKEYLAMEQKESEGNFRYVIAMLDAVTLPTWARGKLHADFSEYSERPSGIGLLHLLYGIVGKPLPDEAVRFSCEVDREVENSQNAIRAARHTGDYARLLELANSNSIAWRSTPALRCHVVESITRLHRGSNSLMEEALKIVEKIEHEFPRAARPRQLKGLVLSNLGRDQEAQQILGELVAAGHTESRILNEYARTWIDRYVSTGQENFLRTARNLRLKAFEEDPTDYFSGINAAAESILLGEIEMGKQYAERVIQGIRGRHPIDGGLDYRDYWEIATAAHAYLILRKYDQAIELYRKVVDTSPLETYSHASTLNSARRLMKPLKAPRRVVKIIELIFQHVPNELTSAWGRAAAI